MHNAPSICSKVLVLFAASLTLMFRITGHCAALLSPKELSYTLEESILKSCPDSVGWSTIYIYNLSKWVLNLWIKRLPWLRKEIKHFFSVELVFPVSPFQHGYPWSGTGHNAWTIISCQSKQVKVKGIVWETGRARITMNYCTHRFKNGLLWCECVQWTRFRSEHCW